MYEMSAVATEPSPVLLDWKSQTPKYLVPPCTERASGKGPVIDLGLDHGDLLLITLGINHVAEYENLWISVWGSTDGVDWGEGPLVALPQKSYCGIYSTFLNLSKHPYVRYLRVYWTMAYIGKGQRTPLFGFSVSAQESRH